ncbi:MAG: hypothetical protein WD042_13320 [Phycisphaeraceae bacterium]
MQQTKDFDGRPLQKGDTVATLTGNVTAKVTDIVVDTDSTSFVCLRPVHRPFSRGVWHAADQVQRIATAKKPAEGKPAEAKPQKSR